MPWPHRIERRASTMQKAATTAVSGREALMAAITGGIARSPTTTS
jgi:hypothetical protein